jgi:hypothetical protein
LVSPTEYYGWPTSLGCSKFFGIEKRKFADLESHLSWGVIGSQFLFIYLFFFIIIILGEGSRIKRKMSQ